MLTRTLVRRGLIGLVWSGVALAAVGFTLPWVIVDVKEHDVTRPINQLTRGTPFEGLSGKLTEKIGRVTIQVQRGAELITGELPDLSTIPSRISGAQVPQLAHREDTKTVLALVELLTGQEALGVKSYAVYLLPGLALLFGLLITFTRRLRLVCGGLGLVALAIAGAGYWKLATTHVDSFVAAVTFGQGLWLSLWAYVIVGLAAVALTVVPAAPHGR